MNKVLLFDLMKQPEGETTFLINGKVVTNYRGIKNPGRLLALLVEANNGLTVWESTHVLPELLKLADEYKHVVDEKGG